MVTLVIAPNSVGLRQHIGVLLKVTLDHPPIHTQMHKQKKTYSKIIFAGKSDRNFTLTSVPHLTSFTFLTYNANTDAVLTMAGVLSYSRHFYGISVLDTRTNTNEAKLAVIFFFWFI